MRNNVFVSCVEELRVRRGNDGTSCLAITFLYLLSQLSGTITRSFDLKLEALIWSYKLTPLPAPL